MASTDYKILLSLPEFLREDLQKASSGRGQTFSHFIRDSIRKNIDESECYAKRHIPSKRSVAISKWSSFLLMASILLAVAVGRMPFCN